MKQATRVEPPVPLASFKNFGSSCSLLHHWSDRTVAVRTRYASHIRYANVVDKPPSKSVVEIVACLELEAQANLLTGKWAQIKFFKSPNGGLVKAA